MNNERHLRKFKEENRCEEHISVVFIETVMFLKVLGPLQVI